MAERAVCLCAPTASGKSELVASLARRHTLRLISADTGKLYRGFDIGTNKPALPGRELYSLIDILEPGERYSAGRFARDALVRIDDAKARGETPLVVGGTVLYLRALFLGLAPDTPTGREEFEQTVEAVGTAELHNRLAALDPASAKCIGVRDRVRVVRALELVQGYGVARAEHFRKTRPLREMEVRFVLFHPDRRWLFERINRRVQRMVDEGWVEEVEALLDSGLTGKEPAFDAIGYREMAGVVRGETELEDAVRMTAAKTRRYAKQQINFMKQLQPAEVADSPEEYYNYARRAVVWLEEGGDR